MAFWGVELKPGRPFTHSSNTAKGRLHISQATLGIGSATAKSVVQCNVGNRSPVFLCSLFPEKLESSQLNLEFDEADDVVLSVLGPRSVHLTGYYLVGGRHFYPNDESESYGEDIANTASERSNHSDEEYEDSFIDDAEPEVFSASPVSSSGASEEQIKHKQHKNRHRRLRKKYRLRESDEDNSSEEKLIPSNAGVAILDSEDEDKLPIASLGNNKCASKRTQSGAEGKADISKKTCGDGKSITVPERKDDTGVDDDPEKRSSQDDLYQFVQRSDGIGSEDGAGINKKKKEHSKKGKPLEVDRKEDFFFGMIIKEDKSKKHDTDHEKFSQLPLTNEEDMKTANYKGAKLSHASLPSTEVDHAQPKKSKVRRKEKDRVDNDCHDNVVKQNHIQSNKVEAGSGSMDLPARNDKTKSQINDEGTELAPDSLLPTMDVSPGNGAKLKRKRKERESDKTSEIESTCNARKENGAQTGNISLSPSLTDKQNQTSGNDVEQIADINQSEEKKRKKKKSKKSRDHHGKDLFREIPPVSVHKNESLVDSGVSNTEDKSSKLRTLSGGLVVKEVKVGKTDGKIAAPGKKISIHYTGKLKNGQIFDSNVEGKPLKFRLGSML
ncbi:FKBP-type peptidyl-prolyl cis-trans isomerase [Tripterygium wilfordii]|uniref:peptidylprolyl isomerase n=1 Tax=Tripterygium wilfordii TaxID=458696 RepID=A0A7J7DNY7_TRIWF|nr:FKBP-type peptidyl-prolyl cis-trans isomerase [Tripterygium wilfordii]